MLTAEWNSRNPRVVNQHPALVQRERQGIRSHHADKSLAQTYAIAKKCPAIRARNLHQRLIAFLLVLVENGEHPGVQQLPFARGNFVIAKVLLQRLRMKFFFFQTCV